MKIEDIIDFIANNTQITVCEKDGIVHYAGEAHGVRAFESLEIERLNVTNNHLIITILKNDILS